MNMKFTYWVGSDGWYLGYLHDYPDHWTQGKDLEDLKEHLKDLYKEIKEDWLPTDKKTGQLQVR